MSKKILIVTNGFFPENSPRSFRATELAKELVRQGHLVKVITHPREGVESFCKENGIQYKSLGHLTWPVPTAKGSGLVLLFWRIIIRFSSLLLEYPMLQLIFLVKKALKGEKGYDALISVAVPYPIHWGVARIHSKKNPIAKVWIADCGDPYVGRENDTFKVPFYFGWVEKWFSRKADFITVPSKNSINAYYKEFHSKIKVIPQGFRFEDIKISEEKKISDKVIFGYGGMFIPGKRDPTAFLSFLNSLAANHNFEFHIYTNTPALVEPFVRDSKGRIKLCAVTERKALLFEMSKMNFVINFENEGPLQTPSKLIDYVIIDKPIFSIQSNKLKTAVFLEFLEGNYANRLFIEDPEQYRIENVARKFITLIA